MGCGSEEFGKYYASEINSLGHDTYYLNDNGDLRSFEDLEEIVYDEYDDISDEEIKEEAKNRIQSMQKLEGLWLYIQP